jgi:hypothetical protein
MLLVRIGKPLVNVSQVPLFLWTIEGLGDIDVGLTTEVS